MVETAKVVAVTGSSGYIGSRLLQQLEEENLEKLVAFDTRPPRDPVHNIAVYRQDVGKPIDNILRRHRVNALVHLAFVRSRGRQRREVREARESNLRTLHSVLESCTRAQVGHVIYLSSHAVYGAHRDNPVPLTELAPLRPMLDFPLSYDKFLCDQVVQSFAERRPETKVTILRASPVLGPSAPKDASRIFGVARPLGVWRHNPPFQFLYEDDLARILAVAIQRAIAGIFNIAGDGVAFYQEIKKLIPHPLHCMPASLAYPLTGCGWGLGLQRHRSTADLDFMRYPVILGTAKMAHATGYRLEYTSLEAVTAFANSVLC